MDDHHRRGRDELLKIVAHELRGALGPLRDWARLLQSGRLGPLETAHAGEVILRSLQIMARLCDDLDLASETSADDLSLAMAPLDLGEVALAVARLVAYEAAVKGIDLQVRVPPAPLMIAGDPVRLAQVVRNLVSNAVKFTAPHGKVLVDVGSDHAGGRIVVTDSGVGIRAEFLPHVFDKFSRERPDDATRAGSGLGLHVVKRLVDLHGGTIEVDSAGPGCGARFVVRLPLAQTVAA